MMDLIQLFEFPTSLGVFFDNFLLVYNPCQIIELVAKGVSHELIESLSFDIVFI